MWGRRVYNSEPPETTESLRMYAFPVSDVRAYHDVFVAEEEHDSARVVQLVHRVEVRHLACVHQVTNCTKRKMFAPYEREGRRVFGTNTLQTSGGTGCRRNQK